MNLLSNATKFTPEGGCVSVDVAETPSLRNGFAHLVFTVSDNGIGMKPEFLENIFSAFTREQDSRVDKIEGSGLGMAITKMIVDMMEGSIAVESRPGEGTTFAVELEFEISEEAADTAETLPPLRALVVDADPENGASIVQELHDLGIEAELEDEGQKTSRADFDFILFNWNPLCENSALRVCELRGRFADVPIVVSSVFDRSQIQPPATQTGATGVVQNPLFPSTLYRCIRQFVLHEEQPLEERNDRTDWSGKRILLVEDNEFNREIAREILENAGVQVESAVNGLESVEKFQNSEPGYYDLILMDVHMPVMDGYEATRCIRCLDRPDAASLPILAMTADAFAEDVEKAKNAGMNGHIAKPIDIPAMMKEIEKSWRNEH